MFLLEVIVSSLNDAIEAELGGADRLELVSDLEHGGLTPSLDLVRQVSELVSLPLRVMLRASCHMSLENAAEREALQSSASSISQLRIGDSAIGHLGIDGLVLGFVEGGCLDLQATAEVLASAPALRATFHRASDCVDESRQRIGSLKQIPQIDRVLTNGGNGSWNERKARLNRWREVLAPEIQIIFAAGNDLAFAPELIQESSVLEIHVGRAARIPQTVHGAVDRSRVAALREHFSRGLRSPESY